MSKYEREWSEIAEKAVADGLNGQEVSTAVQMVVDEIKQLVLDLNPNDAIQTAVWVGGNNYKDPGDVHVYLASGKIERIELKFSRGFGEGTAKNLGGKTFTKKISATITSYPEYEQDLKEQRKVLVESSIGRTLKNDSDYAQQLRAMRVTN